MKQQLSRSVIKGMLDMMGNNGKAFARENDK